MSTTVSVILLVLAAVLAIVGIVGAIVPALPGPPISWLALLLVFFACSGEVSLASLLWMLAFTIIVSVLDYVAPAFLTKLGGGSKASVTGATVGTFAGLLFAPWGLLLGPLVGAFVGEWIAQSHNTTNRLGQSLRVAGLSFVGFILTTGLKLIASLWMTWDIIMAIVHYFA